MCLFFFFFVLKFTDTKHVDFEQTMTSQSQRSLLTAFRDHVSREAPRLLPPLLDEALDTAMQEVVTPELLGGIIHKVMDQAFGSFALNPSGNKPPATDLGATSSLRTAALRPEPLPPGTESLGATVDIGPSQNTCDVYSRESGLYSRLEQRTTRTSNDNGILTWSNGTHQDPQPGPSGAQQRYNTSIFSATDHGSFMDLNPQDLMSLVNFSEADFEQYMAMFHEQPGELASHADSGYYSAQTAVELTDDIGKGKGKAKEVEGDGGHVYV